MASGSASSRKGRGPHRLAAGAPTVTLNDKANTTCGDWGTDGYIYFEVDSGHRPDAGLRRAASSRSTRSSPSGRRSPPSGRPSCPAPRACCSGCATPGRGRPTSRSWRCRCRTARRTPLIRGVFARYAPTGHLLVVTADGKLIAIPFDPKKLELTGPPVALLEGIGVRTGGFNVDLALAGNGTLAYTTGGTLGSRRAVWVSREGGSTPVDPGWDPQGVIESSLSPPTGSRSPWRCIAERRPRHLGQAASRRPVLADHVRRHRRPAGPPGRPMAGTSCTSPTGRLGRRARSTRTGRTAPAPRAVCSSFGVDFGQIAPSRDGRWLILRTAPATAGDRRHLRPSGRGHARWSRWWPRLPP